MNEVCMLIPSRTPNQIRLIPSLLATGTSSGTMMNDSSKKSRKKARKRPGRLTVIRKPQSAAGRRGEQMFNPNGR